MMRRKRRSKFEREGWASTAGIIVEAPYFSWATPTLFPNRLEGDDFADPYGLLALNGL